MNGGALPGWIVVSLAVPFLAFIVFAFRQGFKVTNKQDGDPPDRTGGGLNF